MTHYRVMVSGSKEYWEWVDVKADSLVEAAQLAVAGFAESVAASSGVVDLKVEHVELLEEEPVSNPQEDECRIRKAGPAQD